MMKLDYCNETENSKEILIKAKKGEKKNSKGDKKSKEGKKGK